ncbi:Adenosine monophosphate-protein transferase VbhT [Brevundimonas sp. SH203]|uniref:Fic/DOC family protein n=1 Tax=Brevundimonas sp. SH203 TaxID=345167 RepID=UPI0009D231D4|nr:Fic family protein [Brevundimonas sp. SH203]GAW39761.1 Adenosine monophosphate-protein transferase VbhT [Brevundimonas sp. SH203]
MSRRREEERAEHERVFYPGTHVLVNKLDLRDAATLDAAERSFTDLRITEGLPKAALKPSYAAFKAIHRHLFQDLYSWAGKERAYQTGRSTVAPFARPEFIASEAEKVFARFRNQAELRDLEPDEFAAKAAELIGDLNAIHPFIEGNGRTQRLWLAVIAEKAGYEFSVLPSDQLTWYEASRQSFEAGDNGPMAALILARIRQPDALATEEGEARAQTFLNLTRDDALASGDQSFRAAWETLDRVTSVAASVLPYDEHARKELMETSKRVLADHMRAGRRISDVTAEQAWRNDPSEVGKP